MKKLATLILAAGMVFGTVTGASAIDFKAKGNWTMNFDYGQGGNFVKRDRSYSDKDGWHKGKNTSGWNNKQDEFEPSQRVRLQLDAVASEALSGTVYFEIGQQYWGKASEGAALGTDGLQVKVRRAYLDWIVPNTDLKVRMGLQGIALPSFAMGKSGSQIFDEDVAGIVLSNKFNDNVTLTAFWARPYNDNFAGSNGEHGYSNGFMDNADFFGLTLPMTFDGFKITPFAMVGAVGPNVFTYNHNIPGTDTYDSTQRSGYLGMNGLTYNGDARRFSNGMLPAAAAYKNWKRYHHDEYSVPFWLGVGGEVTAWDPFRLAWDVNYGNNGAQYEVEKRSGWFATLLAEYKMDWGTPGLYGWYSTGDDSNIKNGSERMPTFGPNQGTNDYSNFGGSGAPQIVRDSLIGKSFIGTWGIGARVKDVSFLEGLKHTFAINFYNGTNSPTMAKYILGKKGYGDRNVVSYVGDFNDNEGLYLTTDDQALEFSLANSYKIYDNLTLYTQASYIALFLDQSKSVWGNGYKYGSTKGGVSTQDAWNINVSFMYDF